MRTALSLLALVLAFSPAVAAAQSCAPEIVEADRERIRAHLERVENDLRNAEVSHLDGSQRSGRALAIERIREYRLRGEFPHGAADQPPGHVPTFIDAEGRACAMAQLVIESGHRDVAMAIARDENHARVPEITHPALGPWLDANGITLEEATRIQPWYSRCNPGDGGGHDAEPAEICSDGGGGCYCNVAGSAPHGGLLVLGALAALRARRRRRPRSSRAGPANRDRGVHQPGRRPPA
jgi:MYXO-CTERM domain-containing protein